MGKQHAKSCTEQKKKENVLVEFTGNEKGVVNRFDPHHSQPATDLAKPVGS